MIETPCKAVFILTFSHSRTFFMYENVAVTDFPEGLFGSVSFEIIEVMVARNVTSVHPSVFLQSKERLKQVTIGECLIGDFSWDILPQLTNLLLLDLHENVLTTIPPIESDSLETLNLWENEISSLEIGWSTPNLRHLDTSECNGAEHHAAWTH